MITVITVIVVIVNVVMVLSMSIRSSSSGCSSSCSSGLELKLDWYVPVSHFIVDFEVGSFAVEAW